MTDRAASPLLGTVAMLAVTVVLSGAVGAAVLDSDAVARPSEPVPSAVVSVDANAETGRIMLLLRAGGTLDVRELDVRISVNGTDLVRQPPVPFFSARGFRSGPTGPFNRADDPVWDVGERASVQVAGTNDPTLAAGVDVTVRVVSGGDTVAVAETTART